MRTKALLLTAALSVAGIATSMAQAVYSVNAVGYVNVTVSPGFQLIANPLDAESNKVSDLLTTVPDGTIVYKFDPASGYVINQFISPAPGVAFWTEPDMTLEPGEGAFIFNPQTTDLAITFVGQVRQGDLSQTIPAGLSIQSSQVPQAGVIDADLEYPAQDLDTVYKYNGGTQEYEIFQAIDAGGILWVPSGPPSLAVGEAVFVEKAQATTWSRSFSVN